MSSLPPSSAVRVSDDPQRRNTRIRPTRPPARNGSDSSNTADRDGEHDGRGVGRCEREGFVDGGDEVAASHRRLIDLNDRRRGAESPQADLCSGHTSASSHDRLSGSPTSTGSRSTPMRATTSGRRSGTGRGPLVATSSRPVTQRREAGGGRRRCGSDRHRGRSRWSTRLRPVRSAPGIRAMTGSGVPVRAASLVCVERFRITAETSCHGEATPSAKASVSPIGTPTDRVAAKSRFGIRFDRGSSSNRSTRWGRSATPRGAGRRSATSRRPRIRRTPGTGPLSPHAAVPPHRDRRTRSDRGRRNCLLVTARGDPGCRHPRRGS